MDTGQLAMMLSPLAASGPSAGSQLGPVSGQSQADAFAGLFATMVAGSDSTSPLVSDDVVGETGSTVQFPVDQTGGAVLPVSFMGLSLQRITGSDSPAESGDDKKDTVDMTGLANAGMAVAMLAQPQPASPIVSPQVGDVTEQNAPSQTLDAINSVAVSTAVASAAVPSGAADTAIAAGAAVQDSAMAGTPVQQPNQSSLEKGNQQVATAAPVLSLPVDDQKTVREVGSPDVSSGQPIQSTMEARQMWADPMSSVAGTAASNAAKGENTGLEAAQQSGQQPVDTRQNGSTDATSATQLPGNTEATSQGAQQEVAVSNRFGQQSIQLPEADRARMPVRTVDGAGAGSPVNAGTPDQDSVRSTVQAEVTLVDLQQTKPALVQDSKSVAPAPVEAGTLGQVATADVKPATVASDKRPVAEAVVSVSGQNDPQQTAELSDQGGQAKDAVDNKLVRSVSLGTSAAGHQPVVPTSQEPVASGTEQGARTGQVVTNGVAAQAGSFNPGASGDEAGDLGHRSAPETPQMPQANVSTVHQQAAFNGAEALTQATGVANQSEQSKVDQGHIVNQVKDQLATHEVKQGSDQITLRLSPQNLGDIQVNLRLDNQQLKVEIVAQNHTVRDALMQNMDSLKESLARQNISMKSFDVTTGTGGNSGFQQGTSDAWKQLAQQQQQRQANPWMPSGYHTGGQEEVLRNMPVYLARQEHAMVDLHF